MRADAVTSNSGAGARKRFARFVTVGIAAALLLFALTYLFVSIGMTPFFGSALAYAIAFAVAYAAQRRWTFGARHRHGHALPRYFAVQAGCALFSGLSGHVAATHLSMPPLAMSAIATVAASVASYLLSLFWVFPDDLRAQ